MSHETIYRSLFVQARGVLKKELQAHLRSGRAIRRSRHASSKSDQRGSLTDMISIRERPGVGRGPGGARALGRRPPVRLGEQLHRDAGRAAHALRAAGQGREPRQPVGDQCADRAGEAAAGRARKSLTWDRGKEMAEHKRFTLATDVAVYFCDPQSPWQRGSNENTNGLLRQYFPKGTNLSVHSQERLDEIARQLNGRPRKTLGFETPAERYEACVAMTD